MSEIVGTLKILQLFNYHGKQTQRQNTTSRATRELVVVLGLEPKPLSPTQHSFSAPSLT